MGDTTGYAVKRILESATKTATFSGTTPIERTAGFTAAVITLKITSAVHTDETYDFYITTGDGASTWDIVHFPQVITTGAKTFTATVQGMILPQEVTTATPGISANASGTYKTDTAGAAEGIKTLAAGKVRHGPFGDRINYELVVGGSAPSIAFTIHVTLRHA